MPWSSVTGGARDLIQLVLIPLGGLILAIGLLYGWIAQRQTPDPWLAGIAVGMMGLGSARKLDQLRGRDTSSIESPPSSSPSGPP